MRSRVLAVLLAVMMLPSVTEIVELGVHLVEHADMAHVDHESPEGDEHGCSGLFHMCACHTASSLPSVRELPLTLIESLRVIAATSPRDIEGRENTPPPHRPPIV